MTIDWWTLAIQTVNVIVLVWLLGRFFWRPVAGMIEQRRVMSQKVLADAERDRGLVAQALAGVERTRAGLAKEREAALAEAHGTAERARTMLLEQTLAEAASLMSAAKAAIEKEKIEAEHDWVDQANQLAVDIAVRLAARLDGPIVRGAFLNWLVEQIRELPEETRRAMAENGTSLEAVSATPLDAAEQDRCRKAIGEALGTEPTITFSADPALIAGLEVHGAHLVVSNSWRADLTQILAELSHADRH